MPDRKTTSKSKAFIPTAIEGTAHHIDEHYVKHRKISVPSTDLRVYDFTSPGPRPNTAEQGVSISDYEYIFMTNGVVHRAGNIRANRVVGGGFELLPSDQEGVDADLAEDARKECQAFLDRINYKIFFKQAYLNAWWSGNEWTEIIYNRFGSVVDVAHGDVQTVDFRRNFINNKIILDGSGQPAGYWQYIADLAELYYPLTSFYGEWGSFANFQEARKRLRESQTLTIEMPEEKDGPLEFSIRTVDELPNIIGSNLMVGLVFATTKPNYMLIQEKEMAHLSLNNANDNPYGFSALLPAYNAINHLEQVMYATAEAINSMGYPKPVLTVGDEKHPPTQTDNDKAQDLVTNPTRKESFTIPYWMKLEYLEPGTTGMSNISQYPEWFINEAAVGLRVPKEMLIGGGDANRATAETNSSDFDKDIEADRGAMEKYVYKILNHFLLSRGYIEQSPEQCMYLPKIKWQALVTADDALREKMALERWNADAINFNELRRALKMDEVEDMRGTQYKSELTKEKQPGGDIFGGAPKVGNPDLGGSLGSTGGQPEVKNPMEEGQEITAKHSLDPKAELNPELNKQFHTQDVDYKKVAQKSVGRKISTVGVNKAREIRDAIVNGEAHKKSPDDIIKAIAKIGGYNDAHARMIFITEHKNLMMHGDVEDAQKKGYTHKRWVSTIDKDTSPLCRALNGQRVPIGEDFKAIYIEGDIGKIKSWRGKAPAAHPSCRSFLAYEKEA